MKKILRKGMPILLAAAVMAMCGAVTTSCKSNQKVMMYERQQSNKATKVKSNIKVRGTNKANSHTTRTY
jgi:hypothetical protein